MMMRGLTIRARDLQRVMAGSHQEAAGLIEEKILEKFDGNASMVASSDDAVVIFRGGSFEKYAVTEGEIGEQVDVDVVILTTTDEAIDLRESSERIIEAVMAGDDVSESLKEFMQAIRPEHLLAEGQIDGDLASLLSGERPWLAMQQENEQEWRKQLRGTLGKLKERALKQRFKKLYDGSKAGSQLEAMRHEVLPALHRVNARLKEQLASIREAALPELSGLDVEKQSTYDMVGAFGEGVLDDVGALRQALDRKLRLSSRTAPVEELAKLHDGLVTRVNEIDFATRFFSKASSRFRTE